MTELLIATRNAGKIRELAELLADLSIRLRSLNDFEDILEPEETGATFAENAALKAHSYALQTGVQSLADDSGLEVEALNGAPGIYSARYAGIGRSDKERAERLLKELGDNKNRRARFVCAMAVANEKGDVEFTAEGICAGQIAFAASGNGGFGYDPIFIPEGFRETFGEMPNEIKQQISHRKQAIDKIIQQIRRFHVNQT